MSSLFRRCLRAGAPAVILAAIVCVVFINKAYTIDDQTFLAMSEHMLHDPLHPASVLMVNNGRPADWISNGVWSGPVAPALMMPAVATGNEWLAHVVMFGVFCLGIFATAALALRLGVSDAGARWASLLVVCSSAVLAMAMTEMPDVPTMAFATFGVERLVAYRDERKIARLIAAGVLFALATLSRQHGILVFGIAFLIVIPSWPKTWSELGTLAKDHVLRATVITFLGTVAAIALVYLVMRDDHQDANLASSTLKVTDSSLWHVNVANVPAQWMLTFPLGLAWLVLCGRRMVRSWWCWAALPLGAYLAWQTQIFYRNHNWLYWQVPITALGTSVLVDLVAYAIRRRDVVDLACAVWLLIALPLAVYSHLPPKYLVPSAPAMALVIVREAARNSSWSWARYAVGGVMAIGFALGVLIIQADAHMGAIGREGGELAASYVAKGERVWFDGTWGFQWYAEQAGALPMSTEGPQPQPGDIVVAGQEAHLVKPLPNKQLLERYTNDERGGRVVSRPAGFFSNVAWGPLPWIWGQKPLATNEVWRILPP